MIAGWLAVGVAAGYALGASALRWRSARARAMRPVVGVALRGDPEVTATLDQLVEAARAAALWVEPIAGGFEVRSQVGPNVDRVRVRVPEPVVHVSAIELDYRGSYREVFAVALALVEVFGPLELELDAMWERVDGSKNQHELTNAHASRVRHRALDRFRARRA